MKRKFREIISQPLISGGLIMIIGSNTVNVLNYVYHLIMGRLLGPMHYGNLATILALIGFISIIPTFFGLVIIKFISSAKDKNEAKNLIAWFDKKVYILGGLIFFLTSISAFFLAKFLNIENSLLIIFCGILFIFFIPSFFYRSSLQGLLKFKEIVVSQITESALKLLLGLIFIYVGLSIEGVIYGLVLSVMGGWILSRIFINDFLHQGSTKAPKITPIFLYALPIVIQSISVTSLYSSDLILVKHFFSAYEAGIYASLSTLGKIIFFSSGPIAAVMFPLVSQKQSKGQDYKQIFLFSFLSTAILSILILALYLLIPNLMIKILFGSLYLEGSKLLFLFGIFMTFFTLAYFLINFFLSIGKTKVVILPFLGAILQIVGIIFYHNTLRDVIIVSSIVSALVFLALMGYLISRLESLNLKNEKRAFEN